METKRSWSMLTFLGEASEMQHVRGSYREPGTLYGASSSLHTSQIRVVIALIQRNVPQLVLG